MKFLLRQLIVTLVPWGTAIVSTAKNWIVNNLFVAKNLVCKKYHLKSKKQKINLEDMLRTTSLVD